MSTYFGITTKSEYLLASDIALQCMNIQFNACIQFIALQACIFSSMHVFNPMHGQCIQFNSMHVYLIQCMYVTQCMHIQCRYYIISCFEKLIVIFQTQKCLVIK